VSLNPPREGPARSRRRARLRGVLRWDRRPRLAAGQPGRQPDLLASERNVPHLVDQANKRLDGFQQFLNRNGINIKIESQGQTALQTLQNKLLKGSGSLVSFTGNLLTKVATTAVRPLLDLRDLDLLADLRRVDWPHSSPRAARR